MFVCMHIHVDLNRPKGRLVLSQIAYTLAVVNVSQLLFDMIYCDCLIVIPRNYLQVNITIQRLNIDVVLGIL